MKTHASRHISKTGFTLVELFVCIAIIAILGALLLPALAKAQKESADSSLRQSLAMAIIDNIVEIGASSPNPIDCKNGWYFIGQNVTNTEGPNGTIVSIISSQTNHVVIHFTHTVGCTDQRDQEGAKVVSQVVNNLLITNGTFVRLIYSQ